MTDVNLRAAVFLDRDGVLIEDTGFLADASQIRILEGVGPALWRLREAGFLLIVVTNQSAVARGLVSEPALEAIHAEMRRQIELAGGPPLDAIYYCPHHPEATLPEYRAACDCRKPGPGLLTQAASALDIDLERSFLLGDRMTDVAAGARAGCRTVLVQSPRTADPPIVTVEPLESGLAPDHTCADLPAAVDWILTQ